MASRTPSIIDLLKADHREVEELFDAFEDAEGDAKRQAVLASRIGQALTIHAEIEETLFYPAVLNEFGTEDADLVCEATVEHGTLRGLIAGMNGGDAARPMIQAHVAVLKEYVQHHVHEEENELFPRVEKLDLDLAAMGERMLELKQELTDDAGGPSPSARGSTIRVADVSVRMPAR